MDDEKCTSDDGDKSDIIGAFDLFLYDRTCAHLSATGIDRAPCDDQKVWECDSCSWRYRSVRQLDGAHRMFSIDV